MSENIFMDNDKKYNEAYVDQQRKLMDAYMKTMSNEEDRNDHGAINMDKDDLAAASNKIHNT